MTNALQEVFDEASKLPEPEQDALAAAIRAEMEADAAWETRPHGAVNSHTTERFRRAFDQLPERIRQRARLAYQLVSRLQQD